MGADLYIKNMEREAQYRGFEVSNDAVEVGYFRDCYNSGGLFAVLTQNGMGDFSWWRLSDHEGWFDSNDDMTVEGAKEFLALLEEAKPKLEAAEVVLVDNEPGDKADYVDWLNLLIRFVKLAIEKDSPIIWSV